MWVPFKLTGSVAAVTGSNLDDGPRIGVRLRDSGDLVGAAFGSEDRGLRVATVCVRSDPEM